MNKKASCHHKKSRTVENKLCSQYQYYQAACLFEKDLLQNSILSTLIKYGFYLSDESFNPITRDEKKIIRIEFHGCVNKVKDGHSPQYLKYKDQPKKGNFSYEDYNDLQNWPLWQVAEQSEKFKSIKTPIIKYLQEKSIHPYSLPEFNIYDFQDILYQTFKENETDRRAYLFSGQKNDFIKTLSKEYELEIKQMFVENQVSEKKAEQYLSKMQKFGITDLFTFNKYGEVISDTDIKLSVHHKRPIASMNSKETNVFTANHFSNLCVVINSYDFPLHNIIHLFDIRERKKENNNEQITQMLLMPDDLSFIMGMHQDYCIFKNFNKTKKHKKIKTCKKRVITEKQVIDDTTNKNVKTNKRQCKNNIRFSGKGKR